MQPGLVRSVSRCPPQCQYVGMDDLAAVRTLEMRVDVSEVSASLIGPLPLQP